MGRRTYFKDKQPLRPDECTRAVAKAKKVLGRTNTARVKVFGWWFDVCRNSTLATSSEKFCAFITRLEDQGYKEGTVYVYGGYIWRAVKKDADENAWLVYKGIRKSAALAKLAPSDYDPEYQEPPSDYLGTLEELTALIEAAWDDNRPEVAIVCTLGFALGIRPNDTQYIQRRHITWEYQTSDEGVVSIFICVAKNRQNPSKRTQLEVPISWSGTVLHRFFKFIQDFDPSFNLTSPNPYGKVYNWLRRRGTPVRPMGFRRAFINEVCERVPSSLWTEYTKHINPSMIEAHYRKFKRLTEGKRPAVGIRRTKRSRLDEEEEPVIDNFGVTDSDSDDGFLYSDEEDL